MSGSATVVSEKLRIAGTEVIVQFISVRNN